MTFTQIKNLTPEEFDNDVEGAWAAINKLTIPQIQKLRACGFKYKELNDDDEITVGLHMALQEKVEVLLKETVIDKLTEEQKIMFGFIFHDKDWTWDLLRNWGLTEKDF